MIRLEAWFRESLAQGLDELRREIQRNPEDPDIWRSYLTAAVRVGDMDSIWKDLSGLSPEFIEKLGSSGVIDLLWSLGGSGDPDPFEALESAGSNMAVRIAVVEGRYLPLWGYDAGGVYLSFMKEMVSGAVNSSGLKVRKPVVDFLASSSPTLGQAAQILNVANRQLTELRRSGKNGPLVELYAAIRDMGSSFSFYSDAFSGVVGVVHHIRDFIGFDPSSLLEKMLVDGVRVYS